MASHCNCLMPSAPLNPKEDKHVWKYSPCAQEEMINQFADFCFGKCDCSFRPFLKPSIWPVSGASKAVWNDRSACTLCLITVNNASAHMDSVCYITCQFFRSAPQILLLWQLFPLTSPALFTEKYKWLPFLFLYIHFTTAVLEGVCKIS